MQKETDILFEVEATVIPSFLAGFGREKRAPAILTFLRWWVWCWKEC